MIKNITHKSKILNLPEEYKDCNDMLKQNSKHAYVTCWWAAKLYTPSGIINVSEQSHGRSTGDTVRFRGSPSVAGTFANPASFDGITGSNVAKSAGYSITVGKRDSSGNITNTTDFYHFTVDTNTATSGGVSGGGNNCSAGPATLTA